MKSKAILLALLAFALQTQAEVVTSDQAKQAVRAWASEGRKLGHRFSAKVSSVKRHQTTKGVPFYAVQLEESGTVFTSADTEVEPILAFTSAKVDFAGMDKNSPLRVLLERDLEARAKQAGLTADSAAKGKRAAKNAGRAAKRQRGAARKWARLRDRAARQEASPSNALLGASPFQATFGAVKKEPIAEDAEIDDLRVAPILKTKWGQDYAYMMPPEMPVIELEEDDPGEEPEPPEPVKVKCYNYYTPTVEVVYDSLDSFIKTNENCLCGCVATAMAQLMRRWEWPKAIEEFDNSEFGEIDRPLRVSYYELGGTDIETTNDVLSAEAGEYDWAKMVNGPIVDGEDNCKAIGKLTYDCGVAVGMKYGLDSSGILVTESARIPAAFTNKFGYANARLCEKKDLLTMDADTRNAAICANLDAGCPTLLLITGSGGHAVVGDGYGFSGEEKTQYVHLNMGWQGQCDIWYNLPAIDVGENPESFSGFDTINGVVYNVFAETSGVEVVSGRVSDGLGKGVEKATVALYDGEELVATAETSETGVYSFLVEPGKSYRIEATLEKDGQKAFAKTVTPVIAASTGDKVGNSWGNDMTLGFAVRIGDCTYPSLDAALDAAEDGDVLEILTATELKEPREVGVSCEIVAAEEDPYMCEVAFGAGAGISVAAGGALALSNVAFTATNGVEAAQSVPAVSVAQGGQVSVAGIVDLVMPEGVAAIATADSKGLAIAGELELPLVIDCSAAKKVGEVFAGIQKEIPLETAASAAAMVFDVDDGSMVGRAVDTGSGIMLKWDEAPIPLEDATCYFVDADGVTHTSMSVDQVLRQYAAALAEGRLGPDAEIVVRADTTLSEQEEINGDLRIRGEDDVVITGTDPSVGFTVKQGKLTVENLTFADFEVAGLFVVDGDAAQLEFNGCQILNVSKPSQELDGRSPAVQVRKGFAKAVDSTFKNCRNAVPQVNGNGGAFTVGADGALELSGVTIVECFASMFGGGVYVEKGASLAISGDMTVCENFAGTGTETVDNLFIRDGSATFEVGALGKVWSIVGVRYGGGADDSGNHLGDVFAKYVGEPDALDDTVRTLFNDVNGEVEAAPAGDGSDNLVWAAMKEDLRLPPGDPDAVVRVSNGGGDADGDYAYLEDAVAQAGDGAVLELLRDVEFANDMEIAVSMTLRSSGDNVFTVTRSSNARIDIVADGALVLADVKLIGGTGAGGVFKVNGGALTLRDGAALANFNGSGDRAASMVTVYGGGMFSMDSGSRIENCVNSFESAADGTSRGGALLVDNGVANLRGGMITGCRASNGGGVFIGSEGKVNVGGDMRIVGNFKLDGATPDNLMVYDCGLMELVSDFSGQIGYTEGEAADKQVFGKVSGGLSDEQMVASAHRFTHDTDGDIGMVVKKDGVNLLVWSAALADDGTYTDKDGVVYSVLKGGEYRVAPPTAAEGLVYDGTEQVGVPEGFGYELSGVSAATDAGDYSVTVTPRPGFAWDPDGDASPLTLNWSIAKKVVDMSGVSFADAIVLYDGKEKKLQITGILPEGVTVTYENNSGTDVGEIEAVAIFTLDAALAGNYMLREEDARKTAKLTISSGAQPVEPDPISITSIKKVGSQWELVATPAKQGCWYSLWTSTSPVSDSFEMVPDSSNQWMSADGPITYTVPEFVDGETLRFWQVHAAPGLK